MNSSQYPRQNSRHTVLRELGQIERSLFMLEWMKDPELRRRVQVALNKGEARNALERAVAALRGHGIVIDDESLAHLSPIGWEHTT